ncbi:hypothetical protein A210_09960 [Pseudomonas putida SJTE-1]|uniref:hypothetical protein n=1 Tax=Pseudomonas putida TaxID=303 RepID=UPI0007DE0A90|nr:hypothetical protein [Pseudomonas putida]ANI02932.1 hypothetical protein A210_09960 [Pseudomonas putida SJTE-1]
MDVNVYDLDSVTDEHIGMKIRARESFVLECPNSTKFTMAVEKLEKMIESQGMTCRIYTIGRVAAMGAAAWTGWGTVIAAGAGIAMAAHNIATWSPDYEIGKLMTGSKIYVNYKK